MSTNQPERSPRRGMCAAVLSLEAITLGLTTPVMIKVSRRGHRRSRWPWGWGWRCSCLLIAGMLRSEWAYALGWLVQLGAIGLGFVISLMFFLGTVFALLWATADLLGRKIERERAAAYAAFEAEQQ